MPTKPPPCLPDSQRAYAAIRSPSRTTNQRLLSSSVAQLPPFLERHRDEAPLVGECLPDRVVVLACFLLAEGVDGEAVTHLRCRGLRAELDRHLVVPPRGLIATRLEECVRALVRSQRVLQDTPNPVLTGPRLRVVDEQTLRARGPWRRAAHSCLRTPSPSCTSIQPAAIARPSSESSHESSSRFVRSHQLRTSFSPIVGVRPERPLVLGEQLGDEGRVLAASAGATRCRQGASSSSTSARDTRVGDSRAGV